jgi:PIN domain nuclease of toxin-antitoxin system
VRLLLDTNALLWILHDDPMLGSRARESLVSTPRVLLSEISLLEIAVKTSVRKLPAEPRLHSVIQTLGFERTGIEDRHLARLEHLPLHHRDPFDRFLIAQALTDDLSVLTADRMFARYGVKVIDALA